MVYVQAYKATVIPQIVNSFTNFHNYIYNLLEHVFGILTASK